MRHPLPRPAFAAPAANEAERLRSEAQQRLSEGDAARAQEILRTCVHRHPRFAGCWSDLGIVQAAAGDPEGARASWHRALVIDTGLTAPRFNLAQLALRENDRVTARSLLEGLVARSPDDGAAWKALAETAMQQGEVSRAIRAFETATRLLGGDPAAWQGLSEANLSADRYPEARSAAGQALSLNPVDPRARLLRVLAEVQDLRCQPDSVQAERDLQELLQSEALRRDAAYGLGCLRERQGRPADAPLFFRLALRCDPSYLRAQFRLAQALLKAGRREEGRAEADRYERRFRLTIDRSAIQLRLEKRPDDLRLRQRLKGIDAALAKAF